MCGVAAQEEIDEDENGCIDFTEFMFFFEALSHSSIMLSDSDQSAYSAEDAKLDEFTKTPDELQAELMDDDMSSAFSVGGNGTETAAIGGADTPLLDNGNSGPGMRVCVALQCCCSLSLHSPGYVRLHTA